MTRLPPGTSKWNKIEDRLFASIAMNRHGKPLISHRMIVQLIGSTTTDTGLNVCREIDGNLYPKGIKVTDQETQAINTSRDEFHGEWNYTISPNQQPPRSVYFRAGSQPCRCSDRRIQPSKGQMPPDKSPAIWTGQIVSSLQTTSDTRAEVIAVDYI